MKFRHHNGEQRGLMGQAAHPIRQRLPEYATAAALGQAADSIYPTIAAHLAGCAACRAELAELLDLTIGAYNGQVAPAPSYPQPDLSFLPPAPTTRPWTVDRRGRLIILFSEPLLRAPAPSYTGAARGRLLYRYIQDPGSVEDLEVTIEVFAEERARGQGRVQIMVDVPSRGALDQTGSRVTLRAGDDAWEGETDESGYVDFAPIPLDVVPTLRVEIAPLRSYEL
jgi:hypothetical protein